MAGGAHVLHDAPIFRRARRGVVFDGVSPQDVGLRRALHVLARTEPRIDRGVVRQVEAGVGSVLRKEEQKNAHTTEQTRHRSVQNLTQRREVPSEATRIGDESSAFVGLVLIQSAVLSPNC